MAQMTQILLAGSMYFPGDDADFADFARRLVLSPADYANDADFARRLAVFSVDLCSRSGITQITQILHAGLYYFPQISQIFADGLCGNR